MNKFIGLVLSLILVMSIITGCGGNGLSAKYTETKGSRTLQLIGDNKVKSGGMEGNYSIDNGKITFIFSGKVQQYSYTIVGDSLVIDGIEYKKN